MFLINPYFYAAPSTLLLDLYPSAFVAYSLTRKLRSAYTGAAFKVGRLSDLATLDIGFVNNVVDIAALQTFVGSSTGVIINLYDQSGNGRTTTTASVNPLAPQIIKSGVLVTLAGKPSVELIPNKIFEMPAESASENVSIIAVTQKKSSTTFGLIVATREPQTALFYNGSAGQIYVYSVVGGSFKVSNTAVGANTSVSPQINSLYSGSSVATYINNTLIPIIATSNIGGPTRGFNKIGSGEGGNSDINFSEIVIYNSNQVANQIGINTNINNFYQIYWTGTGTALLDLYPSAAAAYSLRNLSSTYFGPLVRVRRSSDNTEQDFYGLYNGQLDTGSLLAFCGAGNGFVTTWYDQSGNVKNAISTTALSQPQIVVSGVVQLQNNKPTIIQTQAFPNLQYLETTYSFDLATNKLASIFNVGKANTITSGIYYTMRRANLADYTSGLTMVATDGANLNRLQLGRGAGGTSLADTRLLDFYINPTVQSLQSTFISTSNVSIYRNTSSQSLTNTVGTMPLSSWLSTGSGLHNILIGARQYVNSISTPSDPTMIGNYQEYVFYLNDQSTNRVGIESNINTNYDIFTGTGLLDTYPGAAVGYSLRNLTNTYNGPLVRVRRSSDGAELDIYGGASGQLNTTALMTFAGVNTCKIITWYDQSGNGNNASASDPAAASNPTIVNAGVLVISNGKPSLNFIINPLNFLTNIASAANTSIYLVGKSNAANNGPMIGTAGSGCIAGQVNGYYQMNMGATTNLDIYQTGASSADTNFNITSFYYVGSASIYRNNTLIPITTTLTATLSSNTLQNIGNYGGAFSTSGFISEVIIYKANQLSNRTGINGNINTFYTIF
jgi:hypothetical protein